MPLGLRISYRCYIAWCLNTEGTSTAISNLGIVLHLRLFPPGTKVKLVDLKTAALNGKRGVVEQSGLAAHLNGGIGAPALGRIAVELEGGGGIKAIPYEKLRVVGAEAEHECPICYENADNAMVDGRQCGQCCSCGHQFCGGCMPQLAAQLVTDCPTCRASFLVTAEEIFARTLRFVGWSITGPAHSTGTVPSWQHARPRYRGAGRFY